MSSEPLDLEAALDSSARRLTPEENKARRLAFSRGQTQALHALSRLHRQDYVDLKRAAVKRELDKIGQPYDLLDLQ